MESGRCRVGVVVIVVGAVAVLAALVVLLVVSTQTSGEGGLHPVPAGWALKILASAAGDKIEDENGNIVHCSVQNTLCHLQLQAAAGPTIEKEFSFIRSLPVRATIVGFNSDILMLTGTTGPTSERGTAMLLNVTNGEEIKRFVHGVSSNVRYIAMSADFRKVVTGGSDGTAKKWSVETGKLETTFYHRNFSAWTVPAHHFELADPQKKQTLPYWKFSWQVHRML